MKVGVSLLVQNFPDLDRFEARERSQPAPADSEVYAQELYLGSLVEPLGFDSLWTVEHHFTPYAMIPDPLQLLAYFAGATHRIDLGTMVVVLPWHDPVQVAEKLAMLDNMVGDRHLTIGLGRGAGRREFEGLRIDMGESRDRFTESLEILRRGLSQEWFSYEGTHYRVPETSIRPRPRSRDLTEQMYCAWGSPSTLPIAANAGLGMLFIPQKSWEEYATDVASFNAIRAEQGWSPSQPVVVAFVYCSASEDDAREAGTRYMANYQDSARRHYELDEPEHFRATKGYEHYAQIAEFLNQAELDRAAANRAFATSQVFGTPAQCREKLWDIQRLLDARELVLIFKCGDMPLEKAEASMRLFAETVLPAFQQPGVTAAHGAERRG
ncbi:MAG: LLM class flavin-dependent oxidoreductase [Acidimicrobiia bacterium]